MKCMLISNACMTVQHKSDYIQNIIFSVNSCFNFIFNLQIEIIERIPLVAEGINAYFLSISLSALHIYYRLNLGT